MRSIQPAGHPAASPLFLGVDGGGTRTVAILADAQDQLLGRTESGPANLKLLDDAQLARHLAELRRHFARPDALCLGFAGVRSNADRDRLRQAAGGVWPGVPCFACADLEIAMAAAPQMRSNARSRVLVLSGTGSCCYGRTPEGNTVKVGGWGHMLGDKGSAYEIGLLALQSTVVAWDSQRVWPRLGARILSALHLNEPEDLVTWIHEAEKKEIAALAVHVFEAWDRGDRIASAVVSQAAASLVSDAARCASHLESPSSLVQFTFAGGTLLKQPRFAKLVREQLLQLLPNAEFNVADRESAWGAVRLARDQWHSDPARALRLTSSARQVLRASKTTPKFFTPEATGLSPTEQRNPRSERLHRLPLIQAIRLMLSEEAKVPKILQAREKQIASAIQLIVRVLGRGGRLFYVGAGTSGRIGTLDASECPPTFRTSPEQVQAIMAGGQQALWQSIEGTEDDAAAGADSIRFRGVRASDVVIGIAASGRTPFVWGALQEAKARKAKSIFVCFNPYLKIARAHRPDVVLAMDLGPEVLTGSTRLKAGTATKLLLNLFTTLSMVRLGKVVSNLMVDMNPSNQKLRLRAIRIVGALTGATETKAKAALEESNWIIQRALKRLGKNPRYSQALSDSSKRMAH